MRGCGTAIVCGSRKQLREKQTEIAGQTKWSPLFLLQDHNFHKFHKILITPEEVFTK
jgi:hypothetical protein